MAFCRVLTVCSTLALLGCPIFGSDDDTVAGDDDTIAGDDDTTGSDSLLDCVEVQGGRVCHDPGTDLTWERHASGGALDWDAARSHCEDLSLAGVEDWRVPTVSELRTIVRECPATESGGPCGVTDECDDTGCYSGDCDGCDAGSCHWDSALEGPCDSSHWSATTTSDSETTAWFVGFYSGGINTDPKTMESYVRCVRDGTVR